MSMSDNKEESEETADELLRVRKQTKDYLDSIKIYKRETYDDTIVRLIKKVKV